MERAAIISALLDLPVRPLLGLTLRSERLREQAAEEIAATLIDQLDPIERPHRDQLALPL